MLFYVGLVWNERDQAANKVAQSFHFRLLATNRWTAALHRDGLAVYTRVTGGSTIDQVCHLEGGKGVILGHLFRNMNCEQIVHVGQVLDRQSSEAIVRSGGRDLLDQYWGRYVAFIGEEKAGKRWILRDPTGAMPCYFSTIQGVDLFFVDLNDCRELGPQSFTINRDYVAGYVLYNSVFVRETGLTEVSTLLAGECIEYNLAGRYRSFYWDPLAIARRGELHDAEEVVQLVRKVVEHCVHAWASCFDRVLLRLSGGLDSSIILACLASAPSSPLVICQNDYIADSRTDERTYARSVATKFGCQLFEQANSSSFSLAALRELPAAVTPFPSLYDRAGAERKLEFMLEHRIDALFQGHGGDEIFCKSPVLPTAVDYAWNHPFGRGLIGIALDDAYRMDVSVWHILKLATKHGLLRRPWRIQEIAPEQYHVLVDESLKARARHCDHLWHPLYRKVQSISPGQFAHAYNIASHAAIGYNPETSECAPAFVNPLISQPVMELALRIPTFTLCRGGRDRAVARQAFEADLPREIVNRKSKAVGDESFQCLVTQQLPAVREMLLSGYLYNEGYLDRRLLSQVLSDNPTDVMIYISEILDYICVDAWARNWKQSASSSNFSEQNSIRAAHASALR